MEIYNVVYKKPWYRKRNLKAKRTHTIQEIAKRIDKQEQEIQERMRKAIETYGNKYTPEMDLKELEEALNPKQKEMVLLEDVYYNLYMEYMVRLLISSGNMNEITISSSKSKYIVCFKPNTDIYIRPYIRTGDDNIYIEELLVVSHEVANDLRNCCQHYDPDTNKFTM